MPHLTKEAERYNKQLKGSRLRFQVPKWRLNVQGTLNRGFSMQAQNYGRQFTLSITLAALLLPLNTVWAKTDMEIQEEALKARELQKGMNHSMPVDDPALGKFRGVFYGYLPCNEEACTGLKMTLSLNQKHRYLLVIQAAKASNRETFEKGRYEWDEQSGKVTLTPNKEGDAPRRLSVKDDSTLIYLRSDGSAYIGDQDPYLMKRTDVANNRDMHIH